MRIGFDLDGVCELFAPTVWKTMIAMGYVPEGTPCPEVYNWHFFRKPEWGSLSNKAFIEVCNYGVDNGHIFNSETTMEHSQEVMNSLYDAGFTIVIVTDRSFGANDGKLSRENTLRFLERHEYKYHEIYFTAEKTTVDLDYMVDDKVENFVALREAGVKCYLFDQPWNQHIDAGNYRIESLKDYERIVREAASIHV